MLFQPISYHSIFHDEHKRHNNFGENICFLWVEKCRQFTKFQNLDHSRKRRCDSHIRQHGTYTNPRKHLIPYDQNIYMLTTSTENKNVCTFGKGNGIAWHLADSLQALPSTFNYRTNASIIVDEKNYIRIFGGTSERQTELTDVWRGRLNRLAIN